MSVSSKPTLLFVLSSVHRCIIRSNKLAISHPSTHRLVFQQNVGSNAPHHNISYSTAPSSHINTPTTILRPGRQHTSSPICQSSSFFHTLSPCGPSTSSLVGVLVGGRATTFNIRCKSKKKQYDSGEESDDSDLNDNLDEDDFEAPTQFKVQTIHTPSLRIDAVLSKALGLGRHRLEEIFFGSGILMNGTKLLKKGGKMDEGDYVDVVMEKAGDQIKVKRVKLLKVGSQRTSTDKLIVRVRIWKAPFFIRNPYQWTPES